LHQDKIDYINSLPPSIANRMPRFTEIGGDDPNVSEEEKARYRDKWKAMTDSWEEGLDQRHG
jgi:hypothetical protein